MRFAFWSSAPNSPRSDKQDPELVAADLENAMHQVLRRERFKGGGHIRVSVLRESVGAAYLVETDSATTKILANVLANVVDTQSRSERIIWKLTSIEAGLIIAASAQRMR